jgi:hypothetical protein
VTHATNEFVTVASPNAGPNGTPAGSVDWLRRGDPLSTDTRYLIVKAQPGSSLVLSAAKWLLLTSLICFLGFLAWKWVDRNLLHWGIEETRTNYVNEVELLNRLQAFELVSMKHTYQATAEIDTDKALRAGPAKVSLPGWLAGQDARISSEVAVAAGVDLSGLRPDDIEVVRMGSSVQVIIRVAPAQILSTEILPGTTDLETSQGMLTRAKTRIGLSERDLREEAVDRLGIVARTAAVDNGLLLEASRETELRLESFLSSLPQFGDLPVVYDVQVTEIPIG